MFALTDDDLRLKILGCADGPASVNCEATRRGSTVTSCDPIYRFAVDDLRNRIADTYDEILEQTRRNMDEESIRSVMRIRRRTLDSGANRDSHRVCSRPFTGRPDRISARDASRTVARPTCGNLYPHRRLVMGFHSKGRLL